MYLIMFSVAFHFTLQIYFPFFSVLLWALENYPVQKASVGFLSSGLQLGLVLEVEEGRQKTSDW